MKFKRIGSIVVAGVLLSACVSTKQPSVALDLSEKTQETATESYSATDSAKPSPVQLAKGKKTMTATLVDIKTEKGVIQIELYPNDAPKTVENFATHASQGYYNGLTFHRVVPGFVIQGGDPKGNGTGGESIWGETFEDELNPQTESYKYGYKEGVVAMANRGPNTNGSQFFIMLEDNDLPHAYTIFGRVVKGIEVVKQIAVGDKMTEVKIIK